MNKYEQRLLDEWIKYDRIIIALDFDDTIFPYNKKVTTQEDCDKVISILKAAQTLGTIITINTASIPERFEFILQYCKNRGLEIASLNTNAEHLPYGNNGKIYANIYLDDRGGLEQSLEILQNTMKKYQEYKQREFAAPYTT